MSFNIQLEEVHIFFIAEQLGLAYTGMPSNTLRAAQTKGKVFAACFSQSMEESIGSSLRELLREPLKNPEFRRRFIAHFSDHELLQICKIAWPWMEGILIWDKED